MDKKEFLKKWGFDEDTPINIDFEDDLNELEKHIYSQAIKDMIKQSENWQYDNHGSFLDFRRMLRSKLEELS